MDAKTSEPQEKIQRRLAAALHSYEETVFITNFNLLQEAIANINEIFDRDLDPNRNPLGEYDQREEDQERVGYLEDHLHSGWGNVTEEVSDIEGLTLLQLQNLQTAHRVLPVVVEKPSRDTSKEFEETQRSVLTTAIGDVDATLPTEYAVLSSLTPRIHSPGLPGDSYGISMPTWHAETMPIPELVLKFHMGGQSDWVQGAGYTTYAGLLLDPSLGWKWPPAFAWMLCERAAKDGKKERPRAWRIVFASAELEPVIFDSVEEFLRWFAGYHMSRYGDWDDEIGDYVKVQDF